MSSELPHPLERQRTRRDPTSDLAFARKVKEQDLTPNLTPNLSKAKRLSLQKLTVFA